ncbi:MAG: tryptophan-rich sensory protein [Candidatus Aenigmatarchaeota archaeon]|nr:MAG: tryptophan-rich sensory protein [Candidatus Aenigmarchaeota archaeon]
MAEVNWTRLVAAVVICNLAGFAGSLFTTPNIATWYASINKPAFTPPNWVFGPVWTTLFILMGISLYLIWQKTNLNSQGKKAAGIFGVQLFLNIMWSVLFFGLQNPMAAFAEIIILWAFIAATIWLFWRIDRKAAYLLIPYIAWVSFAAFLNYSVWMLN